MAGYYTNFLMVEGPEDAKAIAGLIDQFITWGNSKDDWPVNIQPYGGIDELLKVGVIEATLKQPKLEAVGILVDGDDNPLGRWQSVRQRCLAAFPELPVELVPSGVLATNSRGLRLGVWVMPDNGSHGMLESFLRHCVGDPKETLWLYGEAACAEAKRLGANYREVHRDKAIIHSWLSWQDPPGQTIYTALIERIIKAESEHANSFVDWFCELYQL